MEIEVFKEDHGWSYRVGGVYQAFHPEKPGYEPMTEAEAQFFSAVVAARMGQS